MTDRIFKLMAEYSDLPDRMAEPGRRDAVLELVLYRFERAYKQWQQKYEANSGDFSKLGVNVELCRLSNHLLQLPYDAPILNVQRAMRNVESITGNHEDMDLLTPQVEAALVFLKDEVLEQFKNHQSGSFSRPAMENCLTRLMGKKDRIIAAGRSLEPWEDAILAVVTRWIHRLRRVLYPYKDNVDNDLALTSFARMTKWEEFRLLHYHAKQKAAVAFVYPAEVLKVPLSAPDGVETHYPALYRLDVSFQENPEDDLGGALSYPVDLDDRLWVEVNVEPRLYQWKEEGLLWEPLDDTDRRAVSVTFNHLTHDEWQTRFGQEQRQKKLIVNNNCSQQANQPASEQNIGAVCLTAYLMTPLGPVRSDKKTIALELPGAV